jgi:(S)-ureidoglycine aminohydrolase
MLPLVISQNRAVLTNHYAILPAKGFPVSFLPNFDYVSARFQASPEIGRAGFAQLLLDMDPGGGTRIPVNDGLEHFLYVIEGTLEIQVGSQNKELTLSDYVYIPSGTSFSIHNNKESSAKVEWIKRPYINAGYPIPPILFGNKDQVPLIPYPTIPGCFTQFFLPEEDKAFDMSMKIIHFDPGVYFDVVETHIHEHGLYMMTGCGLYYLGDKLYEVQATDYIWMAPYCPQFYFATGWERSSYMLYKNINRDITF